MTRRAFPAATVVLATVLAGCGGSASDGSKATAGDPTLVDDALRAVVARAPADARADVRFQSSARTLAGPVRRIAAGTFVVGAPTFPVWSSQDGVRAGRVVAMDSIVLVVRDGEGRSTRSLGRSGRLATVSAPDTVARAVAGARRGLEGDGSSQASTGVPSATSSAAVQAVLARRVDGALVAASSVQRPPTGVVVRRLSKLVSPGIVYQLAVLRPTAAGSALERWLAGDAGQRTLRALGFEDAGPEPTAQPAG